MPRIHITGASGTGTTTLGRSLAEHLGCPYFDSDDFIWLRTDPPYQQMRERAERNTMLLASIRISDSWGLGGSVTGWIDPEILDAFDLIVFLIVPTELRLARLREREMRELGNADPEFIAWAASYDDGDETIRSRVGHEEWLAEQKAPVLRLEGDMTNEERLRTVLAQPAQR